MTQRYSQSIFTREIGCDGGQAMEGRLSFVEQALQKIEEDDMQLFGRCDPSSGTLDGPQAGDL